MVRLDATPSLVAAFWSTKCDRASTRAVVPSIRPVTEKVTVKSRPECLDFVRSIRGSLVRSRGTDTLCLRQGLCGSKGMSGLFKRR